MAARKVSHHRRIISKTPTEISKVKFGDVVQFKYVAKDIYDKTPMVFVLDKKGKVLHGINISYMKEYKVQKLLEETDFKKLKNYSLYENSFRTYKLSDIKVVKSIEYETDKMKKIKKEKKIQDKKFKDSQKKLDETKL